MSIAAGFREKWKTVMDAADASRGEADDARFAAMAKAADDAGLILTTKEVIAAYQRAITEGRNGELIERLEATGHWWMVGKGKTRPSEPLYGCLIQEARIDGAEVVSRGEGPSMPSAIERALSGLKEAEGRDE